MNTENLSLKDRDITCSDCGEIFIFTAGQQEFYIKKGFGTIPKRCPKCRMLRKLDYSHPTNGGEGNV